MGIATDARDAAEKASAQVAELDGNLNQDEIFDRLTDGGKSQGIYRENGVIYINASFIKTGFISSDIIKAGKIRSTDFEVIVIDEIYPGETVYPDALLYPNDGEDIQKGIEIDFAAGVIRGAFHYEVTDALEKRIEALEKAVFN
jgi:hypothetical protein